MAGNPLMDAYSGGQASTPAATGGAGGSPLMNAYSSAGTPSTSKAFLGTGDTVDKALTGAGKVAGGFLNIISRPFQAVAGAMQAGKTAASSNTGAARLLDPNVLSQIGKGAARGIEGKQNLSFTQAVTGNKDITNQQAYGSATSLRGILGRAADLAGSIAIDPTTLVGAGPEKELAGKGIQALGDTAAEKASAEAAAKVASQHSLAELAGRDITPIEKAAEVHAASTSAGEAARESVLQTMKDKGIKAAYDQVGGRDAVANTLKSSMPAEVNAEKASEKILKSAEFHGGSTLSRAIEDSGLNKPEQLAKAGIQKAGSTLAETKVGEKVSDAGKFIQRVGSYGAREKQALGTEAGQKVLDARSAKFNERMDAAQSHQAQIKAFQQDIKPGSPEEHLVRLGAEGSPAEKDKVFRQYPELQPYSEALSKMQRGVTARSVKSRALPVSKVFDEERYIPRVLSPEMKQAMKSKSPTMQSWISKQPNEVKQIFAQGGSTKARTLYPDLSVNQANQKLEASLKEAGVLKPGEHFYDPGFYSAMTKKLNTSDEAIAQSNYVRKLSNITGPDGKKLISPTMEGAPIGAKQIDMGPLGKVFVHPSLEKELLGVKNIVNNSEDLGRINKLYNGWLRLYKAGALVGPGAIAKKAMGDIFQNYRAGVKDPTVLAHASAIQAKILKGMGAPENKTLLQQGKFEDVLTKILGEKDAAMYKAARQSGGIRAGFLQSEVGTGAKVEGKLSKVSQIAGAPLRFNSKAFQKTDETMRLWHFMEKYSRNGGDAKAAAASVKKYLYNFNELTPEEQILHKTVAPFYTFMRKNLPSQIEGMIKQPGKYTAAGHVGNALGFTGPPTGIPTYQQNETAAPTGLAKLLGLDPSKAILTPNLPPNAAEDLTAKLSAPLGTIPGLRDIFPASDRPTDAGDAARKFISLFGGPLPDATSALYTLATGKSTFSGAPIPPGNMEKAKILLQGITPATGRVTSAQNLKTRAAILKLLTGVKVSEAKTP